MARHRQILYITALSGSTATLQKARSWGPTAGPIMGSGSAGYELANVVITTTNAVSGADIWSCPGFILLTLENIT